jgi:uncharacterized protein with ParB-like and HNH nuclease domain
MEEPKSLDSLFQQKIFRIPDYQRGYAWRHEQLKDFWEDLINLSASRSHYTGVLTLKHIASSEIFNTDKEYWLVEDYAYQVYHVVDGQQRLTTFIIFLQAFVDLIRGLPENREKADASIYVTDSLNLAELQSRYLFKIKPTGDQFRTYKFGYTKDNPSYHYMRFRVLGESGGGKIEETFYTLNLSNALRYFSEQLHELHEQAGMEGLQEVYKKLTRRFLFNEYVIKDEFDVFVAFETMNNRGKKLSDLELLKNRLIYLTTLYEDSEMDPASRKSLRDAVNDAWKEVYSQLGRNKARPLNDDDFLRAHWIMYFKYSRKTGHDYIRFLLDEQFTPKKIHKKIEREVVLEAPQEMRVQEDFEESEDDNGDTAEETKAVSSAQLAPTAIRDYVNSLKESAVHWFNSFYPELADGMSPNERQWITCLNRVGMAYFRPLIMSILKSQRTESERIDVFKKIERYIFIVFRTTTAKANYGDSEFYNAARPLDRREISLADISAKLEARMSYAFEDGTMRISDFYNILFKKFNKSSGYYTWSGLRYFLFEYEVSLLSESRQKKVDWSDLLRSDKDKVSIEHIYPQTETEEWEPCFMSVEPKHRSAYKATLGNLLLLSMSINSSLQNDSFENKKHVKRNAEGEKLRNGYADGSHSEIEVSQYESWGPDQIKERGIKLLKFMEDRWSFRFKNDEERERLLFLKLPEKAE